VAGPVKPPARRYQSNLRERQAQLTRHTVIEAAQRLFVERGFTATTVAAVAAEADVSAETIYASLGGKRGLLEAVIAATIFGPEAVPLSEQTVWTRVEILADPHERLAAFVDFVCDILERTSPVHAVIRGAADGEAFAVELHQRLLQRRLGDIAANLRRALPTGVRPGLTWKDAVNRFAALASPELHHLLTVELGWTPRQYRVWVHALLDTELLGTTRSSTPNAHH
jgi:AcrR family transcriptional regulator